MMTIILIEIGDAKYRPNTVFQFDRKSKRKFQMSLIECFSPMILYILMSTMNYFKYPSNIFCQIVYISCVGSQCFKSLRKFEFRTIEAERYRIESERKKA